MHRRHGLIAAGILLSGCGGRSSLGTFADEVATTSGAGPGGHAGLATPPGAAAFGGGSPAGGGRGGEGPNANGGSPAAGSGGSSLGGAGGEPSCDGDGDGHQRPECGGDDCDDGDRSVHPGARDTNAEPGVWRAEGVFGDIPGDSRGVTSMAVDSAGGVHVVEGTHGLRYATNERGSWISEMIDPDAAGTPSLALTLDGTVHIAYGSASEVRLATRGRSGFSLEPIHTLTPRNEAGEAAAALAASADGKLHLVYSAGGTVEYSTRTDGQWTVEASFDSSSGALPALALDAAGTPHIAFGGYDGGEALVYATRCGVGFCTTTIAHGPVMSVDLAVDATRVVHFVYGFLRVDSGLSYGALRTDGSWSAETLAPGPSWSLDLELDEQGAPELVMESNGGAAYTRRDANGWIEEPVPGPGGGLSLALDGDHVVHLGFTNFRFDVNTYVGHTTNRVLAPDGIDQNCDGVDGVDGDGDGHAAILTGGTDCDDRDPSVHPFAVDTLGDQLDSDCDGADG